MLVQHQPFQFYSLHCCHGKANSTRIRRRTSHSKIKTYDEFDSEDANSRVVFDFIKPGEEKFGSQEPWSSIAEEDRSGRPNKGTDLFEASDHHYREQFMESFSSANYSKWDDDRAWSSQEWKTEIKTYNRSGRPDKTPRRMARKVRPGHEEILLDGTVQSVRNEETLRDRSGRPDDIDSQEEARPQQFAIGNDETELELSVESRSFVNRVNDQVRKRQKRISNVTGDGEEHSLIW